MSSVLFSKNHLRVDLDALVANYRLLQEKASSAKCAAVVKANAYGIGISDALLKALYKSGCRDFFVATVDEALEVRRYLLDANIIILLGLSKYDADILIENNITPVLNDLDQLHLWQEKAEQSKNILDALLHVDTGMTRLGFIDNEWREFVKIKGKFDRVNFRYIMSHLACAEDNNHLLNQKQKEKIVEMAKEMPNIPLSLANSSGIFLGNEYHFDLVRPGAALYGINPTPDEPNPMKQVVEVSSYIAAIHKIDSDVSVGYGATYKATKGDKIATIPIGYADGYNRALANKSEVVIAGKKAKVVGKISMDLITIDVSNFSDNELFIGQEVEIIGKTITADYLASLSNTIGYEVLTSLGQRFNRD